jgi:hypothetical protein
VDTLRKASEQHGYCRVPKHHRLAGLRPGPPSRPMGSNVALDILGNRPVGESAA